MSPSRRAATVIAAAAVLNLPFGTIYAFSVFLGPMEALLGVSRAQLSFVFGLATVTLTVGMNLAPKLYRVVRPSWLVLACGACSAAGLALTAGADGLAQLVAGYGVLYGLGAGVAFTTAQQAANAAMTKPSGAVNGFIVSLYPLGAMIGAPVFGWAIGEFGLRATLGGLGATVLTACAGAALMLRAAASDLRSAPHTATAAGSSHGRLFMLLASVFFLAASAGLMVMSQAAGIVQAYGGRTTLALGATTFITGAIAFARIGGGWLVDRFAVRRVAIFANLWSLAGALALTLWADPLVAVPALAMIGMGYGFVSGLTAGAVARHWERALYGRVAARLYIAWCAAAVSLPVLAGWIYDRTHGYGAAVLVAAGVNVLGMLVATRLPRT